jgi:hypothetical protein
MLKMIAEARHQSWRYFVTGDESWFFDSTYYERCGPDKEKRPQQGRDALFQRQQG